MLLPQPLVIEPLLPADFDEVTQVWESSVRATHAFLSEADIRYLRPLVRNEFLKQVALYGIRDAEGKIQGFLGVSEKQIEMLFVLPAAMEKGLGKALLVFATEKLGKRTVDVNEQNTQATGFYLRMGLQP